MAAVLGWLRQKTLSAADPSPRPRRTFGTALREDSEARTSESLHKGRRGIDLVIYLRAPLEPVPVGVRRHSTFFGATASGTVGVRISKTCRRTPTGTGSTERRVKQDP